MGNEVPDDLEPRPEETYRCVASSALGFIQQIAVSYLPHGYHHYVSGVISDDKDPVTVDSALLAKYDIALSRSARHRRRVAKVGNVHYIRFERFFVLLADDFPHRFHTEERGVIRNFCREPLQCFGYSIRFRRSLPYWMGARGHTVVRVAQPVFDEAKARVLRHALRPKAELERIIFRLPFEAYAGVRFQIRGLVNELNKKRRDARLEPISHRSGQYHRHSIPVFDPIPMKVARRLARLRIP